MENDFPQKATRRKMMDKYLKEDDGGRQRWLSAHR